MVTRIRQLLEHKHLTPTQFADLIGVGRPVMSHILSERNKPSLEVAQRIGSAFPDISLAWLMFGTGDMLAVEAASPPAAPGPAPVSESAAPVPVSEPLAVPAPLVETGAAEPTTAPVPPSEALPRPFSAPRPVAAPLATSPAPTAEALPEPVSLPEAAPTAAPVVPQPFRAARFVASALPTPEATVPLAAQAASPVPPVQQPSFASLPAAPPMSVATAALPAGSGGEAALLPFLAESGKAIRRIVIFYRDGSFADYQPE